MFSNLFLKKLFSKSKPSNVLKYLIFGLGNIGPDYALTRHNVGFMVLDELASKKDISFEPARYGNKAILNHKGRKYILIKPSTLMNRSGRAVSYWLKKEKVPVERMLVIVDDVSLPQGMLRMRKKGGDGGHNGLTSIIEHLGHQNFPRLRFGIDKQYSKGNQVSYVLGKWEKEELESIKPKMEKAGEMIINFGTIGIERTMNNYNE